MFPVPKAATPAVPSPRPAKKLKGFQARCSYPSFECTQPCIDGYLYCVKHVLHDPNAPFKQCGFVYNKNGRKCPNAAPKLDRRGILYCPEHTGKAQIARIKSTPKHSLSQTPERLLLNLSHYVKPASSKQKEKESDPGKVEILDPFTQVDASKVNASVSDILDYASSSDSDVEPTIVSDTVRGPFLNDSDTESTHNSLEDPLNINFLRNAGIFTGEEVIYITREKLIRLQALYIGQFKRLECKLREKRKKYLHALKKEKETLCNIHDQPRETAKENKIYEKLKALNQYRRRSGFEAILHQKFVDRRAKATESQPLKAPNVPKCIFTEDGFKCGERTLPSAKHCRKHVLSDKHQVLFKACGAVRADIECHEPVPAIFETNCVFHMDLPLRSKLERVECTEKKTAVEEKMPDDQLIEIDVVGEAEEIDPDDDMAGIMRELNDAISARNTALNESFISGESTDTAFSLTPDSSNVVKENHAYL